MTRTSVKIHPSQFENILPPEQSSPDRNFKEHFIQKSAPFLVGLVAITTVNIAEGEDATSDIFNIDSSKKKPNTSELKNKHQITVSDAGKLVIDLDSDGNPKQEKSNSEKAVNKPTSKNDKSVQNNQNSPNKKNSNSANKKVTPRKNINSQSSNKNYSKTNNKKANQKPITQKLKKSPEAPAAPEILPEVSNLNASLLDIKLESISSTAFNGDRVREAVLQLDNVKKLTDPDRPADLSPGSAKLYLHYEVDGLRVPFIIAERTWPAERFGTLETVAFIYIASEIFQQLVENEFPQYIGSMLRVRDLYSPFHKTHNTHDVDINSSMGPNISWSSDGPGMDQHSPNYDPVFTMRYAQLLANINFSGTRFVSQVVYEDQEMMDSLDLSEGDNFGGFAIWHVDHFHVNGNGPNVYYDLSTEKAPINLEQDLHIEWINGVPITEAQRQAMHGPMLDYINSGRFPVGSVRRQLELLNQPKISTPKNRLNVDSILVPASINEEGHYSPPALGENINPSIDDVREVNQQKYNESIEKGLLPNPEVYKTFKNGEPLSIARGMQLSEEFQNSGNDMAWGESNFVRLTPRQYLEIYRMVGIPEYDLVNMVAMTSGESMYYAQIVGDRDIGGSIGAGQHNANYMLDPALRSHVSMFDVWQNAIETREKYKLFWKMYGFDGRLNAWSAVKNNVVNFQTGLIDGKNAYKNSIADRWF